MSQMISLRIQIARYLMIIGIVILHVPPYRPLDAADLSVFEFVKAFFSHGVFRAAVPLLTAISGFLLFSSLLDRQPVRLLAKKSESILVPLVVWNLPLVIALYFIQRGGLLAHSFSASLYPAEWGNWIDGVIGLSGTPLNYPTNFLRDLFAVSLLAPVMGLFLRRIPYVGLLAWLVVYWFNLDGQYVLRNSMILNFYLGGLAATRGWNLQALDRHAPVMFAVFLLCAALIVALRVENREWFALTAPFLVWPSLALVARTKAGVLLARNAKYSFFTFLAHGPILLLFWLLFQRVAGSIPYPVFWAAAPVLVVLTCIAASRVFNRMLPGMASIALGGRGDAPGSGDASRPRQGGAAVESR